MSDVATRHGDPDVIALWRDIRSALRALSRRPAYAIVAIATLAVALAANIAVFSIVNAAFVRPFPARETDRLVHVYASDIGSDDPARRFGRVSALDVQDIRAGAPALETLEGTEAFTASIGSRTNTASTEPCDLVTGGYFTLLGARPAAGRLITTADDRPSTSSDVVVLSTRLATTVFGSAERAVGQTLEINHAAFTVIGVAPAGFVGTTFNRTAQCWVPLAAQENATNTATTLADRDARLLHSVGRLRSAITLQVAQSQLTNLAQHLRQDTPVTNGHTDFIVDPVHGLADGADDARYHLTAGTQLLAVAAVMLLLVATGNVASLLLTRAAERETETALRLALGGTTWRLARSWMVEAVTVAGIATIVGVGLAEWCLHIARVVPALRDVTFYLDYRVALVACGLAAVICLAFSAVPALWASRIDLNRGIRGDGVKGSGRVGRYHELFVVGQIGVSCTLIATAVALTVTIVTLYRTDPGYDVAAVTGSSMMDLTAAVPADTWPASRYDEILRRVRLVRGVTHASTTMMRLLDNYTYRYMIDVPDHQYQPREDHTAAQEIIGPDYFATLGMPMVAGREFTLADDKPAPRRAVVNETMAKTWWPGVDAVGRRFLRGGRGGQEFQVIGVVADAKYQDFKESPSPRFYQAARQVNPAQFELLIRAPSHMTAVEDAVRQVVASAVPELPPLRFRRLADARDETLLPTRLAAIAVALFGLVALGLAGLGVYGLTAFAISRRAGELGIRIALGATPYGVVRRLVGEALRRGAVGITLGLLGAVVALRGLQASLYGVGSLDARVLASGAAGMVLVVVCSAYVAARRAALTDPAASLRS